MTEGVSLPQELTLGSLFDGVAGFPLAAKIAGDHFGVPIRTLWTSEIEEFPARVSRHHFPDAVQLGDVKKIHGGEIEPVDILTFGSPCQNLSQAGNRKGFEGEKSILFFDAIRILEQMLEATGGMYPRFALWENVYGALSSNDGRDFEHAIAALVGAGKPLRFERGAARNAGVASGKRGVVAWRTLDARYFGVPQRRVRVFALLDTRPSLARSPEVLLIEDRERGHLEACRKAWAGSPLATQAGPHRRGGAGGRLNPEVTEAVTSKWAKGTGGPSGDETQNLVVGEGLASGVPQSSRIYSPDGVAPTLDAQSNPNRGGTTSPNILVPEATAVDVRNLRLNPEGESGTLQSKNNGGYSLNYTNPVIVPDTAATVSASTGHHGHSSPRGDGSDNLVVSEVTTANSTGRGWWNDEDVAGTLRVGGDLEDAALIAFNHQSGGSKDYMGISENETTALTTNQTPAIAFSAKDYGADAAEELAPTLRAQGANDGVSQNSGGWMGVVVPVRTAQTGSNGIGVNEEGISYTLDGAQGQAIAFQERGRDGGPNLEFQEDVAYALTAPDGGGRRQEMNVAVPVDLQNTNLGGEDIAGTLDTTRPSRGGGQAVMVEEQAISENQRGELRVNDYASNVASGGGKPGQGYPAVGSVKYGVRRLMPVETERLQGLPDGWTDIPDEKGKAAADGPRYRAVGNGIAIPKVVWIFLGVLLLLKDESEAGSSIAKAPGTPAWASAVRKPRRARPT